MQVLTSSSKYASLALFSLATGLTLYYSQKNKAKHNKITAINNATDTHNATQQASATTHIAHNYFKLPHNVRVQLIQDKQECENVVRNLYETLLNSEGGECVMGFDVEWNPGSKKAALLQFAVRQECFLFHVCHMDELPPSLLRLLEDVRILKVGVGVVQDARQIFSTFGVLPRGLVDLRPVAHRANFIGNGLAGLAQSTLNAHLDKSHTVRCSHWDSIELTPSQIEYAALDAWIGKEIFECVFATAHKQCGDNECGIACRKSFCEEYIDSNIVTKSPADPNNPNPNNPKKKSKTVEELDGAHPIRKSKLYDNCQMMAPTGEILCKCDMKKVKWYMDRNLAEVVSEDPFTIKLKFAPNGMGHAGDAYYMAPKDNKCVGCGATDKLLKHSIVPHCYRAHFPSKFKSRTSHDIVLLCQKCHTIITNSNSAMRSLISREYGVPFNHMNASMMDGDLVKLRAAAAALKKNNSSKKIPEKRVQELHDTIKGFLGLDLGYELTTEDIEKTLQIDPRKSDTGDAYIPHEKLIVEKLTNHADVVSVDKAVFDFVVRWRNHFVTALQPKHMPEHWEVNHPFASN